MRAARAAWPPVPLGVPSAVTTFAGPWAFLATDYALFPRRSWLCVSGALYSSLEHAFQAAKTIDPDARRRIAAAPSAAAARAEGHRVGLRHDWEGLKLDVMRSLVVAKFRDEWLMRRLLASHPRELVNGNDWGDRFWGVDAKTHAGFNHLGRILTALRAELLASIEGELCPR